MVEFFGILLVLVGLGHLALWTRLHCQVHSMPLRQWVIDGAELAIYGLTAAIPLLYLVWWWSTSGGPTTAASPDAEFSPLKVVWLAYFALCLAALAGAGALWVLYRQDQSQAAPFYTTETLDYHDFRPAAETMLTSRATRFCHRLPGNQILQLEVNRKEVFLKRLPRELDGFTITHLSDLHFKGHMGIAFYQEVIDAANQLQSEMMVIAGDIFDREECLAWTSQTIARLSAETGVYFVLGNHEKRLPDAHKARKVLVQEGLIDLGGKALSLTIRGAEVILAGNELPWHPPAADLTVVRAQQFDQRPFKLLLAHTPDQIGWARRHDFDLMLAGHNHGGQIRLPLVGPVVSPSRHGTRYAGGMFYQSPTLLHVSRGISGTSPLRFNCPPEVTQLVLRRGS